ncbi:MAG: hypothetical protein A2Y24_07380 [Clostridiales bacterium GWE2_32_10]|nr:MAG: hypothetical protein A2Y24_07380 [Clostridiales bacterium GWE2_32_10]HBY21002.1 hypothetical protein [Clostridiales bacterium]
MFKDEPLQTATTITGQIPEPHTTAWLIFIWDPKNVGTINVRHLDQNGVQLGKATKTVDIPQAGYNSTVAYNSTEYGYSALLSTYQNTGYADKSTSVDARPAPSAMTPHIQPTDVNSTAVPVAVESANKYYWLDFYWQSTGAVPGAGILRIVHMDEDTGNILMASPDISYTIGQNLTVAYDQYAPFPDKTQYGYVGYSLYTSPSTKYPGTSVTIDTSTDSNLVMFWWKEGEEPIGNENLKILFDPPDSLDLNDDGSNDNTDRVGWTDTDEVEVSYEDKCEPYRRDPMQTGALM